MNEALWPLKDHTKAKHDVLREYIGAWYSILAQSPNRRLVFIDGFAGPGEYVKGEPGSPSIAINAIRSARERLSERLDPSKAAALADVTFRFIEKDEALAAHLRDVVIPSLEAGLPEGDFTRVTTGTFGEAMTDILDTIAGRRGRRLAPAFVMIDPFGYSGYPMRLVKRILSNKSSEVFISFMGSFINRFVSQTPDAVTKTFGGPEWKTLLGEGSDSETAWTENHKRLTALYEARLRRDAGADYVLRFDVYETARRYVYSLFFATNNRKGCSAMKDAMWKVAPSGDFRFVGKNAGQLSMSGFTGGFVDYSRLTSDLVSEFGRNVWIPIEKAEAFMDSDRTGFRKAHLRDKVLKPMEKEMSLVVERPGGVNEGSFPRGRSVRFMFLDAPMKLL